MHTRQETLEIVVAAILAQGKPSMDEAGNCLYRGPNGLKCAAGHLIPDELYSKDIEGKTFSCIDEAFFDAIDHDAHFIDILQRCHDDAARKSGDFISNFKEQIRNLISTLGLSIPESCKE